jgi:hypothetical protein
LFCHAANPVKHRDRLKSVRDTAEASDRGADRIWCNPRNESSANRCKDITDAVIARKSDLINWRDPAPGTSPSDSPTEACGAGHTRRNDPAVNDPDAAWHWTIAAISNSGYTPNPSKPRRDRVVEVDDKDAIRIYAIGEESLHLAIPLNTPVTIKMINRDVGVDSNINAAHDRGELQL